MKSISSEVVAVRGRMRGTSAGEFFGDRRNESDWEWLMLGNALSLLKEAGEEVPEFAVKQESPDFLTFRTSGETFAGVEVTEVVRPDYRRNRFHQDEEKSGRKFRAIPPPHPTPWKSLAQTLIKKFGKTYGRGTWLLLYLDLARSDFYDINSADFEKPWETTVMEEMSVWPRKDAESIDLSRSPFDRILIMSADCSGLMEVSPRLVVLKPARPIFSDEE